MMQITSLLYWCLLLLLSSCSSIAQSNSKGSDPAFAFPGAEGFGAYTKGGRGGKVFIVNNLRDHGDGSFRWAAEAKGPRFIVFEVAGTIHLETPITIKGDCTIAGQTAPGDGICIADQPVSLGGNNIIVRFMRFRMGDKYQSQTGMKDGSGQDDAFGGNRRRNIIIDHCSMSWSTDEVFSIYGGDSTTLQWNLIAEPLNYSYHFEEGDKDWEQHGYGGIWGGAHLSAHHNLFAHCMSRTPRFNGARLGAQVEFVDFCNNVIFNWGTNNVYGGEGGRYNVMGNYYKPGPATANKVKGRIVNPTRNEQVGFGQFYVAANIFYEGSMKDNRSGIHIGDGKQAYDPDTIIMKTPFPTMLVNTQPAEKAFSLVLHHVGASFRRDTLDTRIINDVQLGTGNIIDVQGGFAHGTPYAATIDAWPTLKGQVAYADSDADGIPDYWEIKNGLDPHNPKDANGNSLDKHYTNIEVYVNCIIQ